MSWYYAREGQRIGPVDEQEFLQLVRDEVVVGNTLVWKEGMQDWQPYMQVAREVQAAAEGAPDTTDPAAFDRPVPASDDTYTSILDEPISTEPCCQCGRRFGKEEMVAYQDSWVCGNCKQNFFQRIQEGIMPRGQLNYAGFWIRFVAKFIDGVIGFIVGMLINIVLGVGMLNTTEADVALSLLASLLGIIFGATYTTFFLGRFAATPGKMVCGLKVVRSDGDRISYLRAFGRHFAEMISGIILYIGYIMAAFHDEKASLHDLICDTRVIYK